MQATVEFGLFFHSSMITLTDFYSPLIKVCDSVIFSLAQILDVFPLACCLPERSQMQGQLQIIAPDVSGMQCLAQRQFSRVKAHQPELRSPSSCPAPQFG